MTYTTEGGPESQGAQQPPSIHYNKSGIRAAFAVHKRQSTWTKTHHNFNSISNNPTDIPQFTVIMDAKQVQSGIEIIKADINAVKRMDKDALLIEKNGIQYNASGIEIQ